MTQTQILKFALLGLCTRIQDVKKTPMLEDIREKKIAELEAKRQELHAMLKEA